MPLLDIRKEPEAGQWDKEGGYILAIINVGGLENPEEFALPLPPTEYEDEESPGTFIQPTQGSGYYIETTGLQTKIITINGTTGVRPKPSTLSRALDTLAPGSVGAVQSGVQAAGSIIGGGNPSTAPRKDTGFMQFHLLRNLILKYYEKHAGTDPHNWSMRFYNLKDSESYDVEPLSFRRRRQAGRPMMYYYTLTLRVVGVATQKKLEAPNVLDRILRTSAAVGRFRAAVFQFAGSLAAGVYQAGALVSGTKSQANAVSNGDYWTSLWANAGNSAAGAWSGPPDSPGAAREEARRLVDESRLREEMSNAFLPENAPTFQTVRDKAIGTASNPGFARTIFNSLRSSLAASDSASADPSDPRFQAYASGLGMWENAIKMVDSAPLLAKNPSASALFSLRAFHSLHRSGTVGDLPGLGDALRSLRDAEAPIGTAGASLVRGMEGAEQVIESVSPKRFSRWLEAQGLTDPSTYSGVYFRVKVERGDTPQSIAARHLGDWRRWPEIVYLNELHYPYFSEDGERGTVIFGGDILVPSVGPSLSANSLRNLEAMKKVHTKLSLFDLYLGLDVARSHDGDFMLSPTKDLALVAGSRAFVQNLQTRMETSLGSWYPRPRFGFSRAGVGDKGTRVLFALWKSGAEGVIRSDARVEAIERLELRVEGSEIRQFAQIRLRGVNESQTVSAKL